MATNRIARIWTVADERDNRMEAGTRGSKDTWRVGEGGGSEERNMGGGERWGERQGEEGRKGGEGWRREKKRKRCIVKLNCQLHSY